MPRLETVVAVLLCAALSPASPAAAAGRSLQGLIPLPEVARAFAPAGVPAALPAAAPPATVASAAPLVLAAPTELATAAAPLAPATATAAAAKTAAPQAGAARAPLAGLSQVSGAASDPKAAPARLDAAYDGSAAHARPDAAAAPRAPGAPAPRLPANALPLPIVGQATDYSCGVASLLSALFYWQVYQGHETDLYALLETTPQQGTEPAKIVEGARSFGLKADLREGSTLADLRAALTRGETVIVDFQAWHEGEGKPDWPNLWDDGHYAVVAGMDEHYIYLMDPSAGPGYAFVPLAEFEDRWHDFEDRHGPRQEHRRLAIFLKGKTPLASFPGPLVPAQ